MLPKYCCSRLVGRRARSAGDDGSLERCSHLARRWRQRWVRERACGLAAVFLVMGGAERAQSTVGVSSLLETAARRAVAFALRCCCKQVPRKLPVSRLAVQTLCCLCVLCLVPLPLAAHRKVVVAVRVPNDLSQQSTAERDPSINARVHSGILSLELCVRLLRCCVSALISAVCSTTLSCTADPVAGADLLRCSQTRRA